jgi:hypothetical protein
MSKEEENKQFHEPRLPILSTNLSAGYTDSFLFFFVFIDVQPITNF